MIYINIICNVNDLETSFLNHLKMGYLEYVWLPFLKIIFCYEK